MVLKIHALTAVQAFARADLRLRCSGQRPHRASHWLRRVGLVCALSTGLGWTAAHADNADDSVRLAAAQPADPADSRYVLGLSLRSSPEYQGADRNSLKLKPLWAYQYGRFRISTSAAGSVMGFASDPVGSGVSAELLSRDRWKLGTALRFDSGRQAHDSTRLNGLPDIQRTLRGRIYLSYSLSDEWTALASVSQDLLGRQGGAELGLNLGYRHWLTAQTSVSAGAGVALGDQRYMQTYFGISDAGALASGLPRFAPSAGLKGAGFGLGIMTALTPSWVAFANLGSTALLGNAANSPLTLKPMSTTATIGLAYRCCR